jgi:hypothetical protein
MSDESERESLLLLLLPVCCRLQQVIGDKVVAVSRFPAFFPVPAVFW